MYSPSLRGTKQSREGEREGTKDRRGAARDFAFIGCSKRHYFLTPFGQCSDFPNTAGIAQLVEQLIRNEKVVGSIPISGTI